MPPPASQKKLSEEQRELIKRSVAEGADYEQHWAYMPLQRPPVPIPNSHPVDAFIQERLAKDSSATRTPAAACARSSRSSGR